ncbi:MULTISPECIES: hypothetical protein [unclassified Sphingobium]|uniref:hypothetical protein n=1 Tax=unclassified Sphingobium TaxID=2611147 RepID=UPI0035A73C16
MTMMMAIAALVAGCDGGNSPPPAQERAVEAGKAGKTSETGAHVAQPSSPPVAPLPRPMLVGESIARAEWAKAKAKVGCAPLALVSDAGADGAARRAEFSGGWGVAFDLPGRRSAYGFAGPGVLPQDRAPAEAQRARLAKQWPYRMEIDTLPAPSFAGYGLSGAQPYPTGNPEGNGMESVAYLRVGGQACTYNVWSRISRAHLEALLGHLRVLP